MATVFIVHTQQDYEDSVEFLGAFSTQEKAETFAEKWVRTQQLPMPHSHRQENEAGEIFFYSKPTCHYWVGIRPMEIE